MLERIIRGGKTVVMVHRYLNIPDGTKMMYLDSSNICGHGVLQHLPYAKMKLKEHVCPEIVVKTP